MQQELHDELNRYKLKLEQDPNNTDLLLDIAEIYLELNDHPNALLYIDNAAKIEPQAKIIQARLLHRLHQFDEAIKVIKELIDKDEKNAVALGVLALLYFDLNESELALTTASKALAIDPSAYEAKLVTILIGLPTQETTTDEIESLIKEYPNDPRLYFALGNVYMTNGNLKDAEHHLQKALDIYPGFYDAYISLGWCQLLHNRTNTAFKTYEKAIDINSQSSDAWGGLALIYALKEDTVNAEKMINRAKKINEECFLTTIAQSILFVYKNPSKDNKPLLKALKSTKVSAGDKIMIMVEALEASYHQTHH